ncbi:MAG: glucosyl transferase [Pseudomonadota bacterium]
MSTSLCNVSETVTSLSVIEQSRTKPSMVNARERAFKDGLRIAFFGHDACESTVIKRAQAFSENGATVLGAMFKRERKPGQRRVDCDVIDLGETVDRNYASRLPKLIGAMWVLFRQSKRLRQSDVFYARNIDMLLLAWGAKLIANRKAALVYEVLDVQRVFLGSGLVGKVFRAAERFLLARTKLLVVSSPKFASEYFEPVQNYAGPTFLLENKICPHQLPTGFEIKAPARPRGPPWKIGWFGTLRCQTSLTMLAEIADQLGADVEIELRGRPSREDLTEADIQAQCATRPNMSYFGPFQSPQDLPEIYGRVPFSWCFDYLDAGSNSDWLLPNRVYEGGAFETVCLASETTMTGQYVAGRQLGHAVPDPVVPNIVAFLRTLDDARYAAMRQAVADKPRADFVDDEDTARLLQRFSEFTTT